MKSRLLVVYKPSTTKYPQLQEKLLELLTPVGNFIATREWDSVPEDRVKDLYIEHSNKPFFKPLCSLLLEKKVVTHVYESKGDENKSWVDYVRGELIGHTDPQRAKEGTFRYYVHNITGESIAKADSEKRSIDNGVHCSDSVESGRRECGIFYWDYIFNKSKISYPEMALIDESLAKGFAKNGEGIFFEERLEDSLRKRNLVRQKELFVNYEELPVPDKGGFSYGWKQRGAETFTAGGRVRAKKTENIEVRDFVAKACINLVPEERIKEWIKRGKILSGEGVKTPTLYHLEKGTYYEQYLRFSAGEVLKKAEPGKRKKLIKQIAKIAVTLDNRFLSPREFMEDLRSDGENMYYADYGEDLGGAGKGEHTSGRDTLLTFFEGEDLNLALETYKKLTTK